MSSRRKIAANRANAQHSTGPRTAAGKQQSRHNATRHGLSGKQIVLDGEDRARYDALRDDLMDAYNPANAAESTLVEEIAQNYWRLQRARAIEAQTFDMCGSAALAFQTASVDLDRIRRYMTAIERAYHRAIDQLQETQTVRARQEALKPQEVVADAAPDGFVSQTPEAQVIQEVRREKVFAAGQQNQSFVVSFNEQVDPVPEYDKLAA